MIYQKVRLADLVRPPDCALCRTAPAIIESDYCTACIAARKYEIAAQAECDAYAARRTRIVLAQRIAVLVVCLLTFAAVVGFFCPPFLQPLVLVSGLCVGIFIALVILGAGGENAG